jgi:ketosteroid isomerase-like protein
MSQQNVEIVKHAIEDFNRRDFDPFDDHFTPDFEWITRMAEIEGEIIRGREGVEKYAESLDAAWEEFLALPDEYRDLGDRVLMLGRIEGRGRESGVPVYSPYAVIYDFRGGKISRLRSFLDHGEALRAAGLSE